MSCFLECMNMFYEEQVGCFVSLYTYMGFMESKAFVMSLELEYMEIRGLSCPLKLENLYEWK